jgi:hypothetical protein
MTIEELVHQSLVTHPAVRVLRLEEVAETIRDDALAQAHHKVGGFQRGADLASLLEHPAFLDYFKHGLATGAANVLAANDQNVQAVYSYDPACDAGSEAGEDPPRDAGVHLLVWVTTPSAALEALIVSLDQALAASLKDLPAPGFRQRESVLDVNLISDDDIRRGVNYAGLLKGLFAPPLQVWQRA